MRRTSIFVTATEQHAIRAFEVGAVDYLLKPFTPERFARVLERARDRIGAHASPAPSAPESRADARHVSSSRILVIDQGRAVFCPSIRSIASNPIATTSCWSAAAQRHRLRATIAAVAERLDPAQFLRVNRSMLVRLDAVARCTNGRTVIIEL